MIHHVTCTDPRLARSCNTPNLSVCNSYICNWQTKNSQRYSVQPSLKLLGCRVLSGSTLKSFLLVATNPLAMSFIGKTSSHVQATACSEPHHVKHLNAMQPQSVSASPEAVIAAITAPPSSSITPLTTTSLSSCSSLSS